MFQRARDLVLTDRPRARKALSDEIKRNERDAVDAQLDALAAEERDRIATEEAAAALASDLAAAKKDLANTRQEQHIAAAEYDGAFSAANSAFERLEELATRSAKLERQIGAGSGQRPALVGHARSGALVAAIWHSARPLAKRLGLRVVPGSSKNVRPLTSIYQSTEDKD